MKVKVVFENESVSGALGLELDNIIEIKPMDNCVAFLREHEGIFGNTDRIEAIVPYSNIAYISCEEVDNGTE